MNYSSNIKNKLKMSNNRPARRLIVFGGLVLCALIIIFFAVKFWRFNNYKVEITDSQENTLVYSYYSIDDNVLKCASDTASLTDSDNNTLWTITYEMAEPGVDICEDKIVIYEKNGSNIYICDKKGKVNSFNSSMAIVKAEISKQGNVAVLMDDGSSSQIDYYDSNGSLIATIKTTLTQEGYPMDIALSEDGIVIAASFIRYEDGNPVSDVKFYNFGTAGQAVTDNIVSKYSYSGTIIPEIEFMGSSNCVAFGNDKIIAYEGSKTFQEANTINAEDEIQSTFADDDFFGIVLPGNDNSGIEIVIYNKKGTEKKRIYSEYSYTSIKAKNGYIIMNNRNSICIYSGDGVCKFDGTIDGYIRSISQITENKYALVLTDEYNIIRLY